MTKIDYTKLADVKTITLGLGDIPADGKGCIMQAVSYITGEPAERYIKNGEVAYTMMSDRPSCVDADLATLFRQINDEIRHDARQKLRNYISRVIGTAGDGLAPARVIAAMNFVAQHVLPDIAENDPVFRNPEVAAKLRETPIVTDDASMALAMAYIRSVADNCMLDQTYQGGLFGRWWVMARDISNPISMAKHPLATLGSTVCEHMTPSEVAFPFLDAIMNVGNVPVASLVAMQDAPGAVAAPPVAPSAAPYPSIAPEPDYVAEAWVHYSPAPAY